MFFVLILQTHPKKTDPAKQELFDMGHYVEKQVLDKSFHLSDQLGAFSRVVAADREFSMKLLVENNRSAPEITEITSRFMEPMDCRCSKSPTPSMCSCHAPVFRKRGDIRGR